MLFARLAAEGAGRPVDRHGFADGAWTPELLADAVSAIDANQNGIELRAVQVWFQDNDNGISNENIRWLARIFGCDDPEATSQWQAELKAAKERLASERREKRSRAAFVEPETNQLYGNQGQNSRPSTLRADSRETSKSAVKTRRSHTPARSLAEKCERALSSPASMNLLIAYWLVFCGLGLLNYVLGTLSVTYSPVEGLEKQVGFIWAPTLTILPLVALPLYIVFVSELNTYWKRLGRSRCISKDVMSIKGNSDAAWYAKVNDFTFSFWAITLFCLLFVFGFQWAGIYMPAYLSGDANGVQVDRYLVALVRPEVISISEAMMLSAVGYLYTASYIAVFMFGLLFLIIVARDYHDLCMTSVVEGSITDCEQLRREGLKVVWGSFRVAALGLWIATLVKLQIVYLSSDAKDFVSWLSWDAQAALGLIATQNGWLDNSSVSHFTTFLMMAVTVATFGFCVVKVHETIARLPPDDDNDRSERDRNPIFSMSAVITILSANLLLVGRFEGFSILVALSVLATFYAVSGPTLS